MERLTYDSMVAGIHCWQIKDADNNLCEEVCKQHDKESCEGCPIEKAFNKLAAYEDTGLTPEEITQLNTFVGSQVEKLLAENTALQVEIKMLESTQINRNIDIMDRYEALQAEVERLRKTFLCYDREPKGE